MMHIDEGRLQAYLDQELPLDERRAVDRHLAACDACRGELGNLRALSAHFAGAVAQLDGAPRRRDRAIGWPREASSGLIRTLPRAAVLILFAGAAASATVPGSPVRDWLASFGTERGTVQLAEPEPQEAPVPATPPVEAGVSVEPENGAVEIILSGAGDDLRVQTVFVEGTRAGVYATGLATSSRFETGAGRIQVTNPRGGDVRIELPHSVDAATVTVNGKEYLRKRKDDLRVITSDSTTRGIVFTVQP